MKKICLPLVLAMVYVLVFSALIFVAGMAVEYGRSLLAKWLKLSVLSQKLVSLLDRLLAAALRFFA